MGTTSEGDLWGGVTFEDMLTRAVSGQMTGTRFISADLTTLLAADTPGGEPDR